MSAPASSPAWPKRTSASPSPWSTRGRGGQIGFTEIARARPDGYTLGFLNLPGMNTITLDPERKAAFTIDSFIPIVNQVLDPGFIWVKGDSPYKTLADLVDAAKKNPGKISACTTGILSDDHLAILMVQEAMAAEFRIVHFDGGRSSSPACWAAMSTWPSTMSAASSSASAPARSAGWPSPTPSARSSCPRSRPPRSWASTVISNSTRGVGAQGHAGRHLQGRRDSFPEGDQLPEMKEKMDAVGLALKPMVGAEYAKYYADLQAQAKKYTEWALKMR